MGNEYRAKVFKLGHSIAVQATMAGLTPVTPDERHLAAIPGAIFENWIR